MAKRKWLLGASGGALLAGGIAALPRPAAADLIIDLRINTAASTGLDTGASNNKTGVLSGTTGTIVVDIFGTVTDSVNRDTVSIGAVGGSFLSTGAIQGNFAPNGATGWSGSQDPPQGTVQLVGLRTATYDFAGTGSQPGRQQDIDGDGDLDLGSPNTNAWDDFVVMRESTGQADNASGTPVTVSGQPGREWKMGSVTFSITNAGAGTPTQLKFEPRRNANGNITQDAAWWYEGDMVSPTNFDGIAYPGLPGAVLNTANAFVTISAEPPVGDSFWTGAASNDYDNAGNWTGAIPSGAGATARFHGHDANAGSVVLATPRTLGVISFDNAQSYTLSGAAITLNNGGNPARIVVNNGSHSILNPISGGAVTVERGGSAGTLTLGKLTLTGALTIPAAQAVVLNPNGTSAGSGKVGGLSIGAGGSLDVKDNDLVVTGTAATAIRDLIKAGTLKTTHTVAGKTTGLGWAQGNDPIIAGLGGLLSGQSFGPGDALVKYTFIGDSDLDGDADGDDAGIWGQNFTGELGGGPTATKTWTQGDWDYDGDVDGADIATWGQNFTGELGGGGLSLDLPAGTHPAAAQILQDLGFRVSVVPEPGVLGLFGLIGVGLLSRRTRRV